MPRKRTGSFWEYCYGIALLQNLTCSVVGTLHGLGTALVYENLVRLLTSIAQEWDAPQLFLHHPLEVSAQMTVDEEDIIDALMVGYKHIALVLLQMFTSFHCDGNQKRLDDNLSPPAPWNIAPVVAVAKCGSNAHLQCRHNGPNHQHRKCNKNLVDLIQYINNGFHLRI